MSIAIDPKAGTHFNALKIFVTPHACDEAAKDFGVERAKAPSYVMSQLRKASYIDDIIGDDGNPSKLYAYQRMAIVVAPDSPTVITVYPRHQASASLRDPLEKVISRILKAAQRKETREVKRISICIAELSVERAQYELRRAKTTSKKLVAELSVKLIEVDAEITSYQAQIYEVKREKSMLAKGIVAYV